jgi:hypothetical protein
MEVAVHISPAIQLTAGEVKQQRWQKLTTEFRQMTDRLGKGIDDGILETVVALNALDINTWQSCEGHIDWGIDAPYVDIEAKGTEAAEQRVSEAFDKADEVHRKIMHSPQDVHVNVDEVDELYKEAHRLRKEADKPHLEERRKVMVVLEEFYKERQVPYDRRLHIQAIGARSRIESQGAGLPQILEPEVRQQKLREYQEEMGAFTKFLKEKFFSSQNSLPVASTITPRANTTALSTTDLAAS